MTPWRYMTISNDQRCREPDDEMVGETEKELGFMCVRAGLMCAHVCQGHVEAVPFLVSPKQQL
jgi:hypothetical protein